MSTSTWKWHVAILDDNPDKGGVPETEELLKNLGIEVLIFGGKESTPRWDFLYEAEKSIKIKACQLFLVDMQWEKPGVKEEVRLPDLRGQSTPLSEKLRNFVQKIGEPCVDEIPFPNVPIPPEARGFWLAAALSHLCPYSLICFFSGFEEILNSPVTAAFRQFSHSPVEVIHKHPSIGIGKPDFFSLLVQLQHQIFKQSSEVFEWLIGRVFLPILIGFPPLEGVSGKLWGGDHETAEWTLRAESIFPQWDDWDKEEGGRIKGLSQFVTKPAFRLSQPKERALNSIKHDLKTILRGEPLKLHDLDRPIQTCFEVGSAAEGLLLLLNQARYGRSRSKAEQALKLCDSILENSLRQLDDLCSSYGGDFTCVDHLERKPDISLHHSSDCSLPFDLAHFRRAVEALTDNAVISNGEHSPLRLNSNWDGKHLSIEYVDKSMGFEKFDNPTVTSANDKNSAQSDQTVVEEQKIFSNSIIKSIRDRGVNRGLPLALTFPFFYPVYKMECLISGNWVELFPNARVKGEQCSEWRFGIRWTFDMLHMD